MVYPHGHLLEPRMMGLAVGDVVQTEKKRESGFIILAGRLLVKIRKALTGHLLGLSLAHAVVFISLELIGSAPVRVFV